MTDKCDHKYCDQKATVTILNAGTRLTPIPMMRYCQKHADEVIATTTWFPENYLIDHD